MSFFSPPPAKLVDRQEAELAGPLDDAVLWVDNTSAITIAQDSVTHPKSRHYALRHLRVRDAAEKLVFCPTHLMKADALTKLTASVPQRNLLLRTNNITNPVLPVGAPDDDDEYTESDTIEEA